MILRTCQVCEKEFYARNYQVKIGTGKYCSQKCRGIGVNKGVPVEERIYNFIEKTGEDECWVFTGYTNPDGYGIIGTGGNKSESTHRVIYRIEKGIIPEGYVIMHTCDNPPCCNPKHLILGTQSENIRDMIQKGRGVSLCGEGSGKSNLTEKQVLEIREKYTGERGSKKKLALEYEVVISTITNILNKITWKHI